MRYLRFRPFSFFAHVSRVSERIHSSSHELALSHSLHSSHLSRCLVFMHYSRFSHIFVFSHIFSRVSERFYVFTHPLMSSLLPSHLAHLTLCAHLAVWPLFAIRRFRGLCIFRTFSFFAHFLMSLSVLSFRSVRCRSFARYSKILVNVRSFSKISQFQVCDRCHYPCVTESWPQLMRFS